MNTAEAPPDATDASRLPAPAVLWLMRGLALAGMGVALYLGVTHALALRGAAEVAVPLCGGLRGLDCRSVLNSRYAMWFGVPVAFGGVAAHLAALTCLLRVDRAARPRSRALLVVALHAVAGVLIAAAGWFTYVQWQELGAWCAWCMFEHLVGAMLAVGVAVMFAPTGGGRGRAVGAAAAVVLLGLLVGEQAVNGRGYTDPIEWRVDDERWVEPAADGQRLSLMGGRAELDAAAHLVLGRADAPHVLIEVIDYTCLRCAWFAGVLHGALDALGPDYAVLVVLSPTDAACNRHIETTPERAAGGCDRARLAAAVWLAEPAKFPAFHDWLMGEQSAMTTDRARARAAELVGEAALAQALADRRVGRLVERDIELARWLKVRSMPGLVAGETRFSALPADAPLLAELIRRSFDAGGEAGSP